MRVEKSTLKRVLQPRMKVLEIKLQLDYMEYESQRCWVRMWKMEEQAAAGRPRDM